MSTKRIVCFAVILSLSCLPGRADTNKLDNAAPPESGPIFLLWTGAKLENPYTIATNSPHTLQQTSTTDGYIEAELMLRHVLLATTNEKTAEADGWWLGKGGNWHPHMPDFDLRTGFVFRGNSAPTNFSGSTIAGGSDFYMDASLGVPIWRYYNDNFKADQQLTLELAGGFVTDKNALSVHPEIFCGGGYQIGWRTSGIGTNTDLPGFLNARVGMARVDQPRLAAGSVVVLDSNLIPEFDAKWSPSMGVSIVYPVTKSISLQAGGNVYFTAAPASWNITVGLTLDPAKFFSALLK